MKVNKKYSAVRVILKDGIIRHKVSNDAHTLATLLTIKSCSHRFPYGVCSEINKLIKNINYNRSKSYGEAKS